MPYYRKPTLVDAIRVPDMSDADAMQTLKKWLGKNGRWKLNDDGIAVITIQGNVAIARSGDWIIRQGDGIHFCPCRADRFEATYDEVA